VFYEQKSKTLFILNEDCYKPEQHQANVPKLTRTKLKDGQQGTASIWQHKAKWSLLSSWLVA